MNDIEAKNANVIDLCGKSQRSIISTYNIFEISNGQLKIMRNPENGKIINLTRMGHGVGLQTLAMKINPTLY